MTQPQITLAEQAEQLEIEIQAIAGLSMFNQPAAIKAALPGITGLIKTLCRVSDSQAQIIAKQQDQIKKLTGGY